MDTYIVAVITDVHGYIRDLHRILNSIKKLNSMKQPSLKVKDIIFLGDVFGYGPEQLKCFDILRKHSSVFLPGNHEEITRLLLLHPEKKADLLKDGISKKAINSIEDTIDQLIGERITDIFGRKTLLPAETFQDMRKPEYGFDIVKQIIGKNIYKFDVTAPKIKLLSRILSSQVSEKAKKYIGFEYLFQAFTKYPGLFEACRQRMLRRERVVDIYNFLEKIEKKKTFRLENALFVHDDPLSPGSQKYLVTDEIADDLEISAKDRVILSRISKRNLPGMDALFVGHSHADAQKEEMNKIDVTLCGGCKPRTDTLPKIPSYVLARVNKNRIDKILPLMADE